jgi:hypothetical protein
MVVAELPGGCCDRSNLSFQKIGKLAVQKPGFFLEKPGFLINTFALSKRAFDTA